ncbi:MAG: hypothetical protein IT561_14980 [Alphaproteobacteria bacterium]|nr:hypothetical protein [Alphaproteobacteria bacterium]
MTAARKEQGSKDGGQLRLSRAAFDLPPYEGPVRSYVICSTARSGSTLLGELLRGTGHLGVPSEYFQNPHVIVPMGRRLGALSADGVLDMSAYLAALRRLRTTANGCFGVKTHLHQVRPVLHLDVVRRLLLESRIVWIRRRDVLGQAISDELANQTQEWTRLPGTTRRPRTAIFSHDAVLARLRRILVENEEWNAIFTVNGLAPITVEYEALLADCDGICAAVARYLGLDPPPSFSLDAVPIVQQRDAINETWRARFLDTYHLPAARPAPKGR